MNQTFSQEALRLAPWSMSKADKALSCGLAFDLQYIRRLKTKARPSAANRIGKAAHQALENLLKSPDGSDEQLKEFLRRAGIDFDLTTPEMEELVSYTYNIVSFRRRIEQFKQKHGFNETLVEHRFGLRNDLSVTSFWGENLPETDARGKPKRDVFFRGVWDLGLLAPGYAVIIDHKSGMPPKDQHDVIAHYGHQLKLYAVSALCAYPDLKGVQAAIHYLQSEEIIWGTRKPWTAEFIRKELFPWYIDYINRAATASADKSPRKGWYCSFCEYKANCPLKS